MPDPYVTILINQALESAHAQRDEAQAARVLAEAKLKAGELELERAQRELRRLQDIISSVPQKFIDEHRRRCRSQTITGRRCRNVATEGEDFCAQHMRMRRR